MHHKSNKLSTQDKRRDIITKKSGTRVGNQLKTGDFFRVSFGVLWSLSFK